MKKSKQNILKNIKEHLPLSISPEESILKTFF